MGLFLGSLLKMKFKMEKQRKEKKKTWYLHLESFHELLSHGNPLEVKLKWRKRMLLKTDPRLTANDIIYFQAGLFESQLSLSHD